MWEFGIPSVSDIRVPPLVQSRWSQSTECGNYCYNYYTPNHYVCGCVATAQAQLMRYWSYPTTGPGTPWFTIYVNGVPQTRSLRGGNGSGGPYSWANMVLDPGCSTTVTQRQAIGALTHDTGVSVNMNYTSTGSGTDTLKTADSLVYTFGYSNAKKGYNSGYNLPATKRNNMVNPNLDAGYPIIFGIASTHGGHAIVGDGYGYNTATLYHHLNMGWAGNNDAWYNLPNIDSSPPYDSVHKCVYNVYTSGSGEIISGRVTDIGGIPLSGAIVTATREGGGTYTATTNSRGIYALTKVPSASTYTINVTKTGYSFNPQTVSTTTSINNTTTTGNRWGINFTATGSVTLENLLAFFPFEGNAHDMSGNGHYGVVNGATLIAGYEGQAYNFNGTNNYIQVPLNINPSVYPKLTMGAWAKASSSCPIRQVVSHDSGGYDRSLGIDYRGGGTGWSAFCGTGAVLGYKPVTLGNWTFLAVVYDQTAGTVKLYVDDKAPLTKSGTLGGGHNYLRIGSNPSFGEYFQGGIDNVFVFGEALNEEQIAYIRKNGSAAILSAVRKGALPAILELLLLSD